MRSKITVHAFLCLCGLIVAVPVLAHHSSFAMDREHPISVQGTVVEWYWANPHCLLKFDVLSDSGEIVQWVTETQAPANMIDAGWRKNDLKVGDEVTVTLSPARNGNLVGAIVRVEFADGRTLDATQDRTGVTGNEYHLSGAPTE